MAFPKEFKEALSHLPSSEKDKLILRLLKKILVLANNLLFELLNTDSVENKTEKVQKTILFRLKRSAELGHHSISYLNWDVRELSGLINEHVSITKDKFGEGYLNLILTINVLEINKDYILNSKPPAKRRKFCVAIIARVFKILLIINKLDSDFLMEFEKKLLKLGHLISQNNYIMAEAIHNGLDVNWLLKAEIPEDIVHIYKDIRANGFLK